MASQSQSDLTPANISKRRFLNHQSQKCMFIVITFLMLIACASTKINRARQLSIDAEELAAVGRMEEAIDLYLQAANDRKQIDAPDYGFVESMYGQAGILSFQLGNYQNAIHYFQEGLENKSIYRENGDSESSFYNGIALSYEKLGSNRKAIEYFRLSNQYETSLAERSHRRFQIAANYKALGLLDSMRIEINSILSDSTINTNEVQHLLTTLIASQWFMRISDSTQAIETAIQGINIAESVNNDSAMVISYQNMAQLYEHFGNFDSSVNYYKLAWIRAQSNLNSPSVRGIAKALGQNDYALSQSFANQGKFREALSHAREASKYNAIAFDTLALAYSLVAMVEADISINQKVTNMAVLDKIEELFISIDDAEDQYTVLEVLWVANDLSNNYPKCLAIAEAQISLQDKIQDSTALALAYRHAGEHSAKLSKSKQSKKYLLKAFQLFKGQRNTTQMINVLISASELYLGWGYPDQAINVLNDAISLAVMVGDSSLITAAQNNLGLAYSYTGQYSKGEKVLFKSLEIDPNNASALNNLGLIYRSMGQYEKAQKYFQRALHLRQLNEADIFAAEYNNIANIYEAYGQYKLAMEYYEKAREISFRQNDISNYHETLINMARVVSLMGRIDEAIDYLNEFIEHAKIVNSSPSNLATAFILYGDLLLYEERDPFSMDMYRMALSISNNTQHSQGKIQSLSAIANYHYLFFTENMGGDLDSAVHYYNLSIGEIERVRNTADYKTKRDYLAQMISTYEQLIDIYYLKNDIESLFMAIERSRAKVLREKLGQRDHDTTAIDLVGVQQLLEENEAILVFTNVRSGSLLSLLVTQDSVLAHSDSSINSLSMLYPNNESVSYKLAIKSFRTQMTQGSSAKVYKNMGKALNRAFVKPFTSLLSTKTHLTIIPDGILNYFPFETLVTDKDDYLIENINISYAQSATIWALLKNRKSVHEEERLLAVGGAIYNEKTYSEDIVKTEAMLAIVERSTSDSLTHNGNQTLNYARLGLANFNNIPGSLTEVMNITKSFNPSDQLIGTNANESKIKALSESGELSKYSALHFATHGIAVPEVPELSALVLSQDDLDGTEDGFLTMKEITNLKLNANVVTLSACESGIGKIYPGEGVVGLAEAFTVAGANSVTVSLWSVNDISTSIFMDQLYKNRNQNTPDSNTLSMVKRSFINGDFGEEYTHPFYWAPFIHFGN